MSEENIAKQTTESAKVSKKIENPNLEIIQADIEAQLKSIEVDVTKFGHSLEKVVKNFLRFLTKYEINYSDLVSPGLLLKLLCTVDSRLTAIENKDAREGKSARDRFKLLTITENEMGEYRQLSRLIRRSSAHNPRAQLFDPDVEIKTDSSYGDMVKAAISNITENYVDENKSKFVNEHLFELFPEMRNLVETSQIYKNSGELPFEVKILKLTVEELANFDIGGGARLGWNAFFHGDSKTGKTDIYLCHDSQSSKKQMWHEITHALSRNFGQGITDGYQGIMRRGVNEGLTEGKNFLPTVYPWPRYILETIFRHDPKLEQIAYEAYFGTASQEKLTTAIFNLFGPKGVVLFDFMISNPYERQDKLGGSVLFDFEECMDFFSEGVEDPYLEAARDTKNLQQKFEEAISKMKYSDRDLEDKLIWWREFGGCIDVINDKMKEILEINSDVPFKDIFSDQSKFENYQEFLKKLQDFQFQETEESKEKLEELSVEACSWQFNIKNQQKLFWVKNNKEPLTFSQSDLKSAKN